MPFQARTRRPYHGIDSPSMDACSARFLRGAAVDKAEQALINACGQGGKPFFRPPFGDYNSSVLTDRGNAGLTHNVMWSIDVLGWDWLGVRSVSAAHDHHDSSTNPDPDGIRAGHEATGHGGTLAADSRQPERIGDHHNANRHDLHGRLRTESVGEIYLVSARHAVWPGVGGRRVSGAGVMITDQEEDNQHGAPQRTKPTTTARAARSGRFAVRSTSPYPGESVACMLCMCSAPLVGGDTEVRVVDQELSAIVVAIVGIVAVIMGAAISGGDSYLLWMIIHDWGDTEAILILRNCRQAIADVRAYLYHPTPGLPGRQSQGGGIHVHIPLDGVHVASNVTVEDDLKMPGRECRQGWHHPSGRAAA